MKIKFLALAISGLLPAIAVAQPRGELRQDRREIRTDHREVNQDRRALQDDRRDARRFALLLEAFERSVGQPPAMAGIDQRVLQAINGEIAESNREVVQKGAEAARSQNEAGRSRRELGRDVVRGQPVRAADDRRDLRDDRRDAVDDRRDAQREVFDNNRLRALYSEYSGLAGRIDPPAVGRKRAILVSLNNMAAAELRGDQREIREDHREIREDRRELREDRRQRP